MDFRNTKIRVLSPEHSKAFQEAVFAAGGRWYCNGKTVQTGRNYLFVDSDLDLTYVSIDEEAYFNSNKNREITFDHKGQNMFKVQEGDYVDTSGMNETERREVVQALLDCGVGRGEGFRYIESDRLVKIGAYDSEVYFGVSCSSKLNGRKLTLSDLRSTERDGTGLPPVGAYVEYAGVHTALDRWEERDVVKVIAHSKINGFIACHNERIEEEGLGLTAYSLVNINWVRPIKTESQREREDLYALVERTYGNCHCDSTVSGVSQYITDALIKAGYKRDSK